MHRASDGSDKPETCSPKFFLKKSIDVEKEVNKNQFFDTAYRKISTVGLINFSK